MDNILIFDIETDGLLDELTKLHTLVIEDYKTGELTSYADHPGYTPISEGVVRLSNADWIIGHNIIDFDIPALLKVYPDFKPPVGVRDTIVLSRVIWPNMLDADFTREEKLRKRGEEWIPKQLFGRHSLQSWGYRLGDYKGDYSGGWERWSKEMQDYGEQDVRVTSKLFAYISNKLSKWGYSFEEVFNLTPEGGRDFIQLEHDVQRIVSRQVRYGILFDQSKAADLYSTLLQRKADLESKLQKTFKPWYRGIELVTPTKDRRVKRNDLDFTVTTRRFSDKTGKELKPYVGPIKETYTEGHPYTKVKLKPFSASSRQGDVADRLLKLRGWKPSEFTKDGKPVISEDVLAKLPWPEAKLLCEYYMVEKRLGAVAEGKQAWLKQVKSDGRIHGQVMTNGAVTGRMTHNRPNMGAVPSGKAPYGHQCRELFIVPEGYKLVGCDADALELRDLAGYMARYDGGAYIKTVLGGKKEDGTDMHTQNANVLGCDRDTAKTWFYAFIYGAGDFKLGDVLGVKGHKKAVITRGRSSRAKFLKSLPALEAITTKAKEKAVLNGWIRGLDGRRVPARSEHAALNTILQSAGAIQMKRGLAILDDLLQSKGYKAGEDYEFVANVHDEWQIETKEHLAEEVGQTAALSIKLAGNFYDFQCELAGSYDIGNNWKETH